MEDLFETIPAAVIVIGTDHKITHWNRTAEILTGYKAAGMIGTDRQWEPFYAQKRPILADLLIDDRTAEITQFYQNMRCMSVQTLPGAWEVSGKFEGLEGGNRLFYVIASPLSDEQGRITGAVEMIHDMTHRSLINELLAESEKRYRLLCEHVADGVCLLKKDR